MAILALMELQATLVVLVNRVVQECKINREVTVTQEQMAL